MRAIVGRVRNAPQVAKPLDRLLPKAAELLEQIQADLAQLGDSSALAVIEQRRTIARLVDRQSAYLSAITAAHLAGGCPPMRPKNHGTDVPLPLPAPGVRVDFGHWGVAEEQLAAQMEAANAQMEAAGAECMIGLARLACNASHQLQNLCVASRGGAGTPAHVFLKELDNQAGQAENASRAIMIFSHRWHMTRRPQPAKKLVERAYVLSSVASQGEALVTLASSQEGGQTIPQDELRAVLVRLSRLAAILYGLELPPLPSAEERAAAPRKADKKISDEPPATMA